MTAPTTPRSPQTFQNFTTMRTALAGFHLRGGTSAQGDVQERLHEDPVQDDGGEELEYVLHTDYSSRSASPAPSYHPSIMSDASVGSSYWARCHRSLSHSTSSFASSFSILLAFDLVIEIVHAFRSRRCFAGAPSLRAPSDSVHVRWTWPTQTAKSFLHLCNLIRASRHAGVLPFLLVSAQRLPLPVVRA